MMPKLPPPSLRVDCAQGFVDGWTRSEVIDYARAVAKACARIAEDMDYGPGLPIAAAIREAAKVIGK